MSDRRCTGTTKAGKPCRAAALKDTDRCAAHPVSPGSTRFFGSPEQAAEAGAMGGRPRVPGPVEVARRLVEDNIGAVLTPYWRALGYDVIDTPEGLKLAPIPGGGAKVHSTFEGVVTVSEHDDLGAMMKAAEMLQDRTLGKPRQVVEHSGPKGGPIQTARADIADPKVREHLAAALKASAEAERGADG